MRTLKLLLTEALLELVVFTFGDKLNDLKVISGYVTLNLKYNIHFKYWGGMVAHRLALLVPHRFKSS